MLFSAMATGLWFASRRLGLAAHAYVLLVIELPRVYLGLHYPSDIASGALLGVALAIVANLARIRSRIARPALRWLEVDSRSFYAVSFLVAMQIATMFDYPRSLVSSLVTETLSAARGPKPSVVAIDAAPAPPLRPSR
jgi:undecaprenyl-diphosphatase